MSRSLHCVRRTSSVSLHIHLADEQHRPLFAHFWAAGNAATVARGLKAALDKTNVRRRR